jgi:hypothetical protein
MYTNTNLMALSGQALNNKNNKKKKKTNCLGLHYYITTASSRLGLNGGLWKGCRHFQWPCALRPAWRSETVLRAMRCSGWVRCPRAVRNSIVSCPLEYWSPCRWRARHPCWVPWQVIEDASGARSRPCHQ